MTSAAGQQSKRLRSLACTIVSVCAIAAAAQSQVSVEELFQLLTVALALGYDDEATAHELGNIKLRERLGDEPIAVLKNEGLGPLALRALTILREKSADLESPAQSIASTQPEPTASEREELLRKVFEYAHSYGRRLPDFLCTETTRFYESGHQTVNRGSSRKVKKAGAWRLDQTVTEEVSFYQGRENYKTKLVNGQPNSQAISEIRAWFTRGEFGTVLAMTFAPSSQAQFKWDHWEMLHKERLAVFTFYVTRDHSHYEVCCVSTGTLTVGGVRKKRFRRWVSAYRGLVYVDPHTGIIARFTYQNVDIPSWVDLDGAGNLLDYSPTTIGDQSYWLPGKAVHYTTIGNFRTRHETEFSNYRKFKADSTITFPN